MSYKGYPKDRDVTGERMREMYEQMQGRGIAPEVLTGIERGLQSRQQLLEFIEQLERDDSRPGD